MMGNFEFHEVTKIYFGQNILSDSGRIIKKYANNVLIITGKGSMRANGFLNILEDSLNDEGIGFITVEGISPDPTSIEVQQIADTYKDQHIKAVVGIGGGSAIDAAKAIGACIGDDLPIETFLADGVMPSDNALPIIAIPSTAGTSSELSKGAIITNSSKKLKQGLRGINVFPKAAIIDPEITYTMPNTVTALTGFDVFCHATETYISKKANPITELFSLEAIKIVANTLPKLLDDLDNKILRDEMVKASMLMGFNLANSSNCLPHRMQYPLGVFTSTSHQDGLAAIYPAWVKETFDFSKSKFINVLKLIDPSIDEPRMNSSIAGEIIAVFLNKINLHQSITQLGVKEDSINMLVDGVEGSLDVDPGFKGRNTIYNILNNSL